MTTIVEPLSPVTTTWSKRSLLALIACLSATVGLKIAGVQLLEYIELTLLVYVVALIGINSWRFTVSRALLRLAIGYATFLVLACAGGALAIARPVYVELEGLYRPGLITLARSAELLANASTLILLTQLFRDNRALCLFTMRIYFVVGSLSAVLSFIAFIIYTVFHVYTPLMFDQRATGFLNEGGPYGVYIVGIFVLGWVLRAFSPPGHKRLIATAQVFNFMALFEAKSKAGLAAVAFLIILQLLLSSSVRQLIASVSVVSIVLTFLVTATNVWVGTLDYIASGQAYELYSQVSPKNGNLVVGRVSGLYFVPRMIKAHPWVGVGWGDYGIVRNNVQFRGFSPVIGGGTDQPALGLYGVAAELGIPLILLLIALLIWPVLLVRRLTKWRPIVTLALIQPVAHLCGGQLNLSYPWIVTSFALGMAGVYTSKDAFSAVLPASELISNQQQTRSMSSLNAVNL